jgi:hypothetical protein
MDGSGALRPASGDPGDASEEARMGAAGLRLSDLGTLRGSTLWLRERSGEDDGDAVKILRDCYPC